jgi:hypothetical protein
MITNCGGPERFTGDFIMKNITLTLLAAAAMGAVSIGNASAMPFSNVSAALGERDVQNVRVVCGEAEGATPACCAAAEVVCNFAQTASTTTPIRIVASASPWTSP